MLNLTHRLSTSVPAHLTLALTAEDRSRSRHYFEAESGQGVYLRLPRGTVLRHGDLLQSEDGTTVVQVIAKPEPVMVVTAQTPLQLLRAAYHLGNRHVPLEVTADYLQCLPDSVLKAMLEHLGLIQKPEPTRIPIMIMTLSIVTAPSIHITPNIPDEFPEIFFIVTSTCQP